ncbi:MAG: hypothetical protein ACR2NO_03040 [Chloroflexota bacterium]
MIALAALAVPLLALGAVLLLLALGTVALAPILASRAASATTKPKLERRASGDDRMRALISAQRTERMRARGLSGTLTRTGILLAVLSMLSLLAGIAGITMGSI